MIFAGLSANDVENWKVFGYWGSIMVVKTLGMVLLIGRWRHTKKIFLSPEDVKAIKNSKLIYDDPDIERCRRAHLNDLENILPWAISTALWLTTSPTNRLASLLIKSFGIARILHTFVYAVVVIPQPARFLAFSVGCGITIYQSLATIAYYS